MVKVAIVGGTSFIASFLVPIIAETKKHDVVVVSRRPTDRFSHLPNVQHKVVDLSDPASLDAALEGAHTIISTLLSLNGEEHIAAHLAVLHSALRVGAKRFAPSEFAPHSLPDDPIEVYRAKAVVVDTVRKSGIEYTLFDTGFFTDLLGANDTYPYKPIFDVENCTARIPGDGSAYMVYICREDMAKFVAASLELEKWPEVSRMIGDRKTFNEILHLLEEVRERKFDVTYVSLEELRGQLASNQSNIVEKTLIQMYIEMLVSDRFGSADASLNELCPEVKPMRIEEFLKLSWGSA